MDAIQPSRSGLREFALHSRAGGTPAIPIRFDCQAVNETGEPLRQAQESLRSLLFFCAWRLAELETVKAGGIMP